MPLDVQEALPAVFQRWGGLSPEKAQAYLASLLASRRLQLETWS